MAPVTFASRSAPPMNAWRSRILCYLPGSSDASYHCTAPQEQNVFDQVTDVEGLPNNSTGTGGGTGGGSGSGTNSTDGSGSNSTDGSGTNGSGSNGSGSNSTDGSVTDGSGSNGSGSNSTDGSGTDGSGTNGSGSNSTDGSGTNSTTGTENPFPLPDCVPNDDGNFGPGIEVAPTTTLVAFRYQVQTLFPTEPDLTGLEKNLSKFLLPQAFRGSVCSDTVTPFSVRRRLQSNVGENGSVVFGVDTRPVDAVESGDEAEEGRLVSAVGFELKIAHSCVQHAPQNLLTERVNASQSLEASL